MRKTKEEAEQTRLNILDAALEVFVEKTYDKSTLNEIAKKAGVTRGAVYWHFENKFDILKNLHIQKGQTLLEEVINRISDERSPIKRILKTFNEFFNLFLKDEKYNMYRRLIEFKISDSEEIKEITKAEIDIIHSFKTMMIDLIDQGKDIGEIREDIDTEFMAISFLNWSMGLQRISMQFSGLYDIESKKELILDNIEKMIRA